MTMFTYRCEKKALEKTEGTHKTEQRQRKHKNTTKKSKKMSNTDTTKNMGVSPGAHK